MVLSPTEINDAFPARSNVLCVQLGLVLFGTLLACQVLTRCSGARNSTVPTMWVEVGGGGHSMSDLWGLEEYIVGTYGRR